MCAVFTTSPRVHLCAPAAAVTSSLFGYASHFLKGQSRCFPLIYWPFLANLSPPPVPLSFFTILQWNGKRDMPHVYIFYFYMDIRRCMQSWLCVSSCPPDLLRPSINWAGAVLTPRSLLRPLLSSPLSLRQRFFIIENEKKSVRIVCCFHSNSERVSLVSAHCWKDKNKKFGNQWK